MTFLSHYSRAAGAAFCAHALRSVCLAALVTACGGPESSGSSQLSVGARGPDVEFINTYLTEHGYFPNEDLAERHRGWTPAVVEGPAELNLFDERTEEALRYFQAQFGLEVSGVADGATIEMMRSPQCGNPIMVHDDEGDKWHHDAQWSSPYALGGTFTYRIIGTAGASLNQAQTSQAVRTAFNSWEQHIGVDFQETTGSSHIIIRFVSLGLGSVLGVTYNNFWGGSRYSIDIDNTQGYLPGSSVLNTVLVHELGHLLGFNHSGFMTSLMFPNLGPNNRTLSDDDLANVISRYRTWRTQPGKARDIGVGAAGRWVIGNSGTGGSGFGIHRFNGIGWIPISGSAVRVAVGDEAWVVNSTGRIYMRTGTSPTNIAGTGWSDISGSLRATDIGVGANQNAWVISNQTVSSGGNSIFRRSGSGWVQVSGAAVRIAVGDDGTVVVVNGNGLVFRRTGITASNPSGTGWALLNQLAPNVFGNETGFAKDVGVARNGVAWVTGTADGNPMTFVRQEQPAVSGPGGSTAQAFARWVTIPGEATNIDAYVVHDPWITHANRNISRRLP